MPLPEKLISDEHWKDTARELILMRAIQNITTDKWCRLSFEERCYLILDESRKYFQEHFNEYINNNSKTTTSTGYKRTDV